jgi:hypothetical protein
MASPAPSHVDDARGPLWGENGHLGRAFAEGVEVDRRGRCGAGQGLGGHGSLLVGGLRASDRCCHGNTATDQATARRVEATAAAQCAGDPSGVR